MKILFSLGWVSSKAVTRKHFKSSEIQTLFGDYLSRISKFVPCQSTHSITTGFKKNARTALWICERSRQSSILSSEEVAHHLELILAKGCQELYVAIGGPDGFSEQDVLWSETDLRWSFGKLTLPHELAALVASEQLYRAWTILRGLPYHSRH